MSKKERLRDIAYMKCIVSVRHRNEKVWLAEVRLECACLNKLSTCKDHSLRTFIQKKNQERDHITTNSNILDEPSVQIRQAWKTSRHSIGFQVAMMFTEWR